MFEEFISDYVFLVFVEYQEKHPLQYCNSSYLKKKKRIKVCFDYQEASSFWKLKPIINYCNYQN
jgi:hypothetical protein